MSISPSVCPNRPAFAVQHARCRRSEGERDLASLVLPLRLHALVALHVLPENVLASLLLRLPDRPLSLLDLRPLLVIARLHLVDAFASLLVLLLAELLSGQRLRLQVFQLLLSLLILFLF